MGSGPKLARQSVAVRKYLNAYAEPEAARARPCPGEWQHAAVIPASDEGESLFSALESFFEAEEDGARLAVVVVNGRVDVEERVHEKNTETLSRLRDGTVRWSDPGLYCVSRGAQGDVLVVDRATIERRFPAKEGVGLARKIGADIALALWASGKIRGDWLFSTDADVRLPVDYLRKLDEAPRAAAAATFPFVHCDPGEALTLYEMSLHYYVLGLRHAASPYAFHTIGSALAFRFTAYAEVRGVPRRQAGEDFYLLNKLAKQGAVFQALGAPISILDRLSERVPFGTGPAVRTIGETLAAGEEYRLYHPSCFIELGRWQRALLDLADTAEIAELDRLLGGNERLARAVETLRLRQNIIAIVRHRDAAWRRSSLIALFDGFRSLKLIHALRDQGLESLPWRETLTMAPFVDFEVGRPDEALAAMRARCFLETDPSP